jgi:hypothetical protein
MALDDMRGVAQIVRECRQGALGKDIWEERFSTGELRHDVDEGEGEGTLVLLGWMRS